MDFSYLQLTPNTSRHRRLGLARHGQGLLKVVGHMKKETKQVGNMPAKVAHPKSKGVKQVPAKNTVGKAGVKSDSEDGALLAPPESSDSSEDEDDDRANIKASVFKSTKPSTKHPDSIADGEATAIKDASSKTSASSKTTRNKAAVTQNVATGRIDKRKLDQDVLSSSATDIFGTILPKKKCKPSYGAVSRQEKQAGSSQATKVHSNPERSSTPKGFTMPADLGSTPVRKDSSQFKMSLPNTDGLESSPISPSQAARLDKSVRTTIVGLKGVIDDSADEEDSLPDVFRRDDGLDSPNASPMPASQEKPDLKHYMQAETQAQAFQNYAFDDSGLLTQANELLADALELKTGHQTVWNIASTADHDLTQTQAISVCPMCYAPVDSKLLEAAGDLNTRAQEAFCRSHQRSNAEQVWDERGYPQINWEGLSERIPKYKTELKSWIDGHDSHYRTLYSTALSKGQNRSLRKTGSNLIPGYYGPRGSRIITEFIMNNFTTLLKQRAPKDRVMSKRSVTAYVQAVLVMEVASRLIADDMHIDLEEARTVLQESVSTGELMCDEPQERTSRRIVASEGEEDTDEDELA